MSENDKNNKKLIDDLSQDLKPVKPLLSSTKAALIFSLLGYGLVFIGVIIVGFRYDIGSIFHMPSLIVQLVALLVAGVFSVIATFRLSRPREKMDKTSLYLILSSAALIAAVVIYCAMMGDVDTAKSIINKDLIVMRLRNVFLIALAPILLMIYMMRRARPVHTSMIGLSSFLAITAMAVTGCRLTCPIEALYANLLWHYGPIIILALLGYLLGRFIYRW